MLPSINPVSHTLLLAVNKKKLTSLTNGWSSRVIMNGVFRNSPFRLIPIDVHRIVMKHCNPKSMIAMFLCCKNWYRYRDDQRLWKHMAEKTCPHLIEFIPEGRCCRWLIQAYLNSGYSKKSQDIGCKTGDDCVYYGDLLDDKREGKGIINWNDGAIYSGDFLNDLRHGQGNIIEYPSSNAPRHGGEYEGGWKYDEMHGNGRVTWNTGNSYHGTFRKGLKDGRGIYRWKDGTTYDGDWKNDKRTGFGVYTSTRSFIIYEGHYENSACHGQGVLTWVNDNSKYTGTWERGYRSGHGLFTDSDGNVHEQFWNRERMPIYSDDDYIPSKWPPDN